MRLIIFLGSLFLAGFVYAESAVRFPVPELYGEKAALVYDDKGVRIGRSTVSMEKLDQDVVAIVISMSLDNGVNARMSARLRFIADHKSLQLTFQETYVIDKEGHLISQMTMDHASQQAVCINAHHEKTQIKLPEKDQVVNVPLNLLLKTLAAGDKDRVGFQTLSCGDEIALYKTIVERAAVRTTTGIVETRYRFELGMLVSLLAAPFIPRISFWFESGYPHTWIGHRMPLYSDGPTVLILREGYLPEDL